MDKNDIILDDVKVKSLVLHKKFGECTVNRITKTSIYVYSPLEFREIRFDYPQAFYEGYLSVIKIDENEEIENAIDDETIIIITDDKEEIMNNTNNNDKVFAQKKKINVPTPKAEDYSYSGQGLKGKEVTIGFNNAKINGTIVNYQNKGNNVEGRLITIFDGKEKYFLYPSCFAKEQLSFKYNEDYKCISKDMELYSIHNKEAVLKRQAELEQKHNTINSLSKHLSCVKKFETVRDFCDKYIIDINSEISYLKSQKNKSYRIINGKFVTRLGDNYVYSFDTEEELSLLPDFDINICLEENNYIYGKVIACEENNIMFSCSQLENEHLRHLDISFDAWFIMENLNKRLEELSDNHNDIVSQLVCGDSAANENSQLKYGQEIAIKMSCSNPITFIWGPPGTGKTYTLADIVKESVAKGKRVLMLSYSNVSVDSAILEVENHIKNYGINELIRYGYPKDKELLNRKSHLTSYNAALNRNPNLKQSQQSLVNEKEKTDKATKRYQEIQNELKHIKSQLEKDEEDITKSAKFVATTLSKAICDNVIYNQQFDTVVIDEASMAYTPQIIYVANLATKHFCCIGDFNQLPPIVKTDNHKNMLFTDIFEYCGDIDNMAILDNQRRMHEKISNFISGNMYFNLLKTDNCTKDRLQITNSEPFLGSPIAYVDIHDFKTATKKVGTSNVNVLSALITFNIALQTLYNNDFTVGIITPYREQATLLNALLSTLPIEEYKQRISCATVHQFQGSQRDIIIYDATDAKGEIQYPGTLLTSNKHNLSNRLFNVAMTRARGKFIVVADREFIDKGLNQGKTEKSKNSKSLFFSLSRLAYDTNSIFKKNDFDVLSDNLEYDRYKSFYSDNNYLKLYNDDIINCKQTIEFNIPGKITSEKFDKKYLKTVDYLEHKHIDPIINISSYHNKDEIYNAIITKCYYVLNYITIIDREIIWIGDVTKKGSLCWRIKSKTLATKLSNSKAT